MKRWLLSSWRRGHQPRGLTLARPAPRGANGPTSIFPRRPAAIFLALLAVAAAAGEDLAVVEGRVALPDIPPPPVIPQRYDGVNRDGAVATSPPLAVVYLEGNFSRPATPATAQLAQKGQAFVPSLLAIQTGTRVEFPNLDDTFHNVFSFSPTKRFDLGRYRPNDTPVPSQVFDSAGLVTLRCEIHAHMRGLILVLDTPHFVVTDRDGHYRLAGLPAGKYVLKAWIDSKTTRAQPVEIGPGGTLYADFP